MDRLSVVLAAARAPSEVRSEYEVPLADEVLDVGMPLNRVLPVGVRAKEKQRRQPVPGLTPSGFVDQPGDFTPVKAPVFHELGPYEKVRIAQCGRLVVGDLARVVPRVGHDPDVAGHRGVGVVVHDPLAVGMPHVVAAGLPRGGRAAVDAPTLGELQSLSSLGRYLEDVVLIIEAFRKRNPFSVRRPAWLAVLDVFSQQHPRGAGRNIDHAEVVESVSIRDECNRLAVPTRRERSRAR